VVITTGMFLSEYAYSSQKLKVPQIQGGTRKTKSNKQG
jgi:hypothetical protein